MLTLANKHRAQLRLKMSSPGDVGGIHPQVTLKIWSTCLRFRPPLRVFSKLREPVSSKLKHNVPVNFHHYETKEAKTCSIRNVIYYGGLDKFILILWDFVDFWMFLMERFAVRCVLPAFITQLRCFCFLVRSGPRCNGDLDKEELSTVQGKLKQFLLSLLLFFISSPSFHHHHLLRKNWSH